MNLFRSANRPKKYRGIVGFLGLSDWWGRLVEKDRAFLRLCCTQGLSVGGKMDPKTLDTGDVSTTQTSQGFLNTQAHWAISARRFALAESCLLEALEHGHDVIDRHFTYLHLIDMCYKQRNEGYEWVERCIEYCQKDIELFPAFKNAWVEDERERLLKLAQSPYNSGPERNRYLKEAQAEIPFTLHVPSFTRLAIIYKKAGRLEDAEKVYQLENSYGLSTPSQHRRSNAYAKPTGYSLFDEASELAKTLDILKPSNETATRAIALATESLGTNISTNTKARAHKLIGEVYLAQGKKNRAIASFEQAVRLYPGVGCKRLLNSLRKHD